MDLDKVLTEIGEFGNYQIIMYVLLSFPLILSSMASLSYVFTAGNIDYRCKVPECETNDTVYDEPWTSFAFPPKNGKLVNKCLRFKSVDKHFHENCTENIFVQNEIEECHDFVFKNNENTIVKEFNLLCEKNNWKRTLVGTLNNVGLFIGMPLLGIFSDKFGRKNMIITSIIASSIMITFRSFSTNYIQFVIFEVMDALVSAGLYTAIFVLGIEIIGPKKRALGGVILSCYFSIGEVLLGLLVGKVDNWRIYLRVIAIPGYFMIFYYWIMPESIRWLISNKKRQKVSETLNTMCRINKKVLSDDAKKAIEELENTESKEIEKVTSYNNEVTVNPLKQVITSKIMLLRVLNCSFCWVTNAFVFYGLSLSSVSIGGNKYSNFILVSLIEIPGYILTWLVIDVFGRKFSLSSSLVISGISCIMFHFIGEDLQYVKLMLFLIGKGGITVSFTALYVCASEMFPTNIRNSLMAFCSTIGRFGSMLAPQMPLLAAYVDPVFIFGSISFVAGTLALYFPETLNCKLPDTVAEAEAIGKESKMDKK